MARNVTLTMNPTGGTLYFFVARVDGKVEISAFANGKIEKEIEIGDSDTQVVFEAHGLPGGRYTAMVDLPDPGHDSTTNRKLTAKSDRFAVTV